MRVFGCSEVGERVLPSRWSVFRDVIRAIPTLLSPSKVRAVGELLWTERDENAWLQGHLAGQIFEAKLTRQGINATGQPIPEWLDRRIEKLLGQAADG